MPLTAGQSLSNYVLVEPLGAGSMGEVWRARDRRLERDVAIKVLPEALAGDEERLLRFEREARTLASLNHPNVGQIWGVDRHAQTYFLALELVPGEDLSTRLQRGPLPVGEAIDLCRQIAEGLEAAHEAGVVHRDLKPANVRVTPDGVVKLLDFGLAKPNAARSTTEAEGPDPELSQAGLLLGTPTHMSPEQVRGRPVDRRADVWAFGCVLYECLSGRRPFPGKSVADVLAAIVDVEPDWSALPAETPSRVRALLARCLEKDPRQRLRDIGEARIALSSQGDRAADPPPRSRTGARAAWVFSILAGLLLGSAATAWKLSAKSATDEAAGALLRSTLLPPDETAYQSLGDFGGPAVISPDGTHLAFVGTSRDGRSRLWLRPLDQLQARALPGTEGAYHPFWSPDSRSLAFFAEDALRRVDLDGGAAVVLCPVSQGKGGAWRADGTIVYAPDFMSPLYRIQAAGGDARPGTRLGARQTTHRWPFLLPGGEQVLYFAASHDDTQARRGLCIATLGANDELFLVESDASGLYCDGHLLFVQRGVLVAQRFDPTTRTLHGEPRLLGERVRVDASTWRAQFDAHANGTLVYQPDGGGGGALLRWVDRAGAELGSIADPGVHLTLSLSPSSRYLLAESQVSPNSDLWVHDLAGGARVRLTLEPSDDGRGIWSPDDERVAYQSNRGDGIYRIYSRLASGVDRAQVLYEPRTPPDRRQDLWPIDWSPDGRWMLLGDGDYSSYSPRRRLCLLDLTREHAEPLVLVESEAGVYAQFAPDGAWIAYSAFLDGREEVHVAAFDAQAIAAGAGSLRLSELPQWTVSRDGGSQPRWRGDGRELYYLRGDRTLVAVPLAVEGRSLRLGEAVELFTAPIRARDYGYDVTGDGQRFILNLIGDGDSAGLALVSDWRAELRLR